MYRACPDGVIHAVHRLDVCLQNSIRFLARQLTTKLIRTRIPRTRCECRVCKMLFKYHVLPIFFSSHGDQESGAYFFCLKMSNNFFSLLLDLMRIHKADIFSTSIFLKPLLSKPVAVSYLPAFAFYLFQFSIMKRREKHGAGIEFDGRTIG